MSAGPFFSRRRCLVGLLAALAQAAAGAFIRTSARNAPDGSDRALLALLDDPHKARAIGLAYLRTLPNAACSAEHLVSAIYADATLDTEAPTQHRYLVNERVRCEFSEGTVVAVDGWFLSLTEARLYALAALA